MALSPWCGPVIVCANIILSSVILSCLAAPSGLPTAPRMNPFQGPSPNGQNAFPAPPPPNFNYAQPPVQYQPPPPQYQVQPTQQFIPPPQQYIPPAQPMPVQPQYLPVQSNYVQPPSQQPHYVSMQPLPASGNSIYQPMPHAAASAQAPAQGFNQGGEYEAEGGNSATSGAFYGPPQMSLLDSYYAPRQGAYQAHASYGRQNRGGLFGNLFGGGNNNLFGTLALAEWMF